VSSRGAIQVIGQRIHVGIGHAGRTVIVEVDEHLLRVLDDNNDALTVVAHLCPQGTAGEISLRLTPTIAGRAYTPVIARCLAEAPPTEH